MKRNIKSISLVLLTILCNFAIAQPKKYSTSNAHSHNDYLNASPFYAAFKNGFASIEADIYPLNGKLLVAHSKKEINAEATLKKLYLEPLALELSFNPSRKIKLLVDIKDNYKASLDLLIQELSPLKAFLSSPDANKPLTILITGTRPPPSEYKNYPSYLMFDDDLKLAHTPAEWQRIGQVSLSFTRYSTWKGDGKPSKADLKKLKHTVDSVHNAGKTIRFWAAPDNTTSWKLQKKLRVDLIGTDKIEELATFLRK
ncbi:PI-PLC domain-containing protein [Daejeonella lutea]|uniref:Alkaline phosphatase n=1 Tax=Daejeonella lutea TaxID=572036 RepID=A0A1T5AEI4_9SPHI|nr:hypothetical protein [Daejeonella lutea]SKB33336.1 alkaline phosphatase [Daejeonella lutea]